MRCEDVKTVGMILQDCTCQPPFPPGCDCDPGADEPDSSCSAGTECVQCRCLPRGCDCDPDAADPDGFCPAGEVCQDCRCERPLPPGCDCDPESNNPDYLCPADLRYNNNISVLLARALQLNQIHYFTSHHRPPEIENIV